jgi:hypothetical protein
MRHLPISGEFVLSLAWFGTVVYGRRWLPPDLSITVFADFRGWETQGQKVLGFRVLELIVAFRRV